VLLVGVVLIVGALTFFPALSLGPILEHLLLHAPWKAFLNGRDNASGQRIRSRETDCHGRKNEYLGTKIIGPGSGGQLCASSTRAGMVKNPVMFVVEVGSVLTTALLIVNYRHHREAFGFNLQITLWLWFTVLFANFAEAMAEGRGKAQADTLRKAKGETIAKRYKADGSFEEVVSGLAARRRRDLRRGRAATSPATAK
jgi:hypothetical protein